MLPLGEPAPNKVISPYRSEPARRSRASRWVIASCAIILSGCAVVPRTGVEPAAAPKPETKPPAAAPSAAAEPTEPSLETIFEREQTPFPLLDVADPKGRWRAQLDARLPPKLRAGEGVLHLDVDIGTTQAIRCEIHDAQFDPGLTVSSLLGKAGSAVQLEHVSVYRVSSVRQVPLVALEALYETKGAKPRVGAIKIAFSPRSDFAVFCVHDEPGYRESFARSVESLTTSLTAVQRSREPQHGEVWRLQVGEAITGYRWERIFAEPDGNMLALSFTTLIAQLTSGEVHISSEIEAHVHDGLGILRGNYTGSVGMTRVYDLAIERDPKGLYSYRGELSGKPLEGQLDADQPLHDYYEVLLALQQRKGSPEPHRFHQLEYDPSAPEQSLSDTDYALDPGAAVLTSTRGAKKLIWSLSDGLPVALRTDEAASSFRALVIDRRSTLGPEVGVSFGAQPVAPEHEPLPLAVKRREFVTQLFAETSSAAAKAPPPKLLSLVRYRAPLGENVAYVSPLTPGRRRPAIIWVAGGSEFGIDESAWMAAPRTNDQSARALREAGLVLMLPALRGASGNPGKNECFFGEVDDVIAAAEYLSQRADVDPQRIYLGGHSTGATLALLVAASSDRFRAVFAFGPVADPRQYGTREEGGCLPSDAPEPELLLRAPVNFVSSIRTPTFIFEGALAGNAGVFDDLRERASARVHFKVVPNTDHFSLLAPGTEAVAKAILNDTVDDAHLRIQ